MALKVMALKEEGNGHFSKGNYPEAEECYTQAILRDSKNPKLFTNRAMTRLKLLSYSDALSDCLHALELDPLGMKPYYLLSQAQLALHHPNEALSSALTAYQRCVESRDDKSVKSVSDIVLACKKEKWVRRERERERERDGLLKECVEGVWKRRGEELRELDEGRDSLGELGKREERRDIERAAELKEQELHSIFAVARERELASREVPDYLIDNVTFSVMHDPVTTKTGTSYDRSTMIEHLKRSQKDPLTAEPLRYEDLRPNRALKEACEKFLEENGWAVDW